MTAKWFQRLYIPVLLLIVTAGMFTVLKVGYKPAPQKLMAPSFFDKPEEIGIVAYKRLFPSTNEKMQVFFGVPPQPEWHREILLGFMKAAASQGKPFDAVIAETQMPELNLKEFPNLKVLTMPTNSGTQAELIDALSALSREGKRTLIYMPSVYSTHLLKGNAIDRFRQATGQNPFTISTAPLALRPDQEYIVDPPCVGSERDGLGTAELGCVILHSGRGYYRKLVPQDRWVAIMNSPYPEDHLLMVSVPGQGRDHSEENEELRMKPPEPKQGR